MAKFKILAIQSSKSRNGGSNIRCQEVVKHAVFGTCNGREFIIQTDGAIDAALVNTEMEAQVRFEPVKYSFTDGSGKQVDVEYTRGIPY